MIFQTIGYLALSLGVLLAYGVAILVLTPIALFDWTEVPADPWAQ